ncbi:MAG: ABC transporter ATP-binding protein [Oscillospiraceae bacterium]|nr:ABC transporter ATP-binding protein [Oscillospiraceae bacterium]
MKELNVTLEHVRKAYARPVLEDVNLEITNDSYIAVVGRSGSGKSTLLNILGLVEERDGGEYRFNGKKITVGGDYAKLRRENIGFIFQAYHLIPTLSCRENILLPTLYGKGGALYDELVERLQLEPLLGQRVNTLSGGEKQRVAIARALILDPCLILADEPTGNLDPANREIIYGVLHREHEKGRGILVITHDKDTAAQAETVLRLESGRLVS